MLPIKEIKGWVAEDEDRGVWFYDKRPLRVVEHSVHFDEQNRATFEKHETRWYGGGSQMIHLGKDGNCVMSYLQEAPKKAVLTVKEEDWDNDDAEA